MPVQLDRLVGNGSCHAPYELASCDDFILLHDYVQQGSVTEHLFFRLVQDVDLSVGCVCHSSGERRPFLPIGSITRPFKGHFDGQSHVVTGLQFDHKMHEQLRALGLFGGLKNATVCALTVKDAECHGHYPEAKYLGIVAGWVKNSVLTDIHVTGHLHLPHQLIAGGVVGTLKGKSHLSTCSFEGTIHGGNRLGGLVGFLYQSKIETCQVQLSLTGVSQLGGFAGLSEHSSLSHCQGVVALTGHEQMGGLCGFAIHTQSLVNQFIVTLTGAYRLGGVIGHSAHCSIRQNTVNVNLKGISLLGGLIGQGADTMLRVNEIQGAIEGEGDMIGGCIGAESERLHVRDQLVSVNLSGTHFVGGFLGYLLAASHPKAVRGLAVKNVLVVGAIQATDWCGGIWGDSFYDVERLVTTLRHLYWDIERTTQPTTFNLGVGVSSTELKQKNARRTLVGFNFATTWIIDDDYPKLKAFVRT